MGETTRNLGFAVRTLWASPTFTLMAVMTLALGIGATTAIFSVIEEVILRPLPYPNAGQLVVLGGNSREMEFQDLAASSPEYRDYAERATTLEAMRDTGR